jgi:hypothetical protein
MFADDQVVIAQSKEDLECMCRKLQEEYFKWGLNMNIAKKNYLSLGTDKNHLEMDNGDIINGCTEFRYSGTIFSKDGRDNRNVCYRVTKARKIIGALNGVWWSKNMTRNRKKMIYNSMVKSVLIYGAEIWSLYENDRRRINATEMDALRRSARISKLDRKTNEYIRGKMYAQDLSDEITRKTTNLVWSCRENGRNKTTKNYDSLET